MGIPTWSTRRLRGPEQSPICATDSMQLLLRMSSVRLEQALRPWTMLMLLLDRSHVCTAGSVASESSMTGMLLRRHFKDVS